MTTLTAKEARQCFSRVIKAAEQGDSFEILRRGRRVACIGPIAAVQPRYLPSLTEFRQSVKVRGASLCKTLLEARKLERY